MSLEFRETSVDDDALEEIVDQIEELSNAFIIVAKFPSGQVLGYQQGDVDGFMEALQTSIEENPLSNELLAAKVQARPTEHEGEEVFPALFKDVTSSVGEGMHCGLDGTDEIEFPDRELAIQINEDLASRRELGIKKYGTSLQTNNGRDGLLDAYQEALDLIAYLKQKLIEVSIEKASDRLKQSYWMAMAITASLRQEMNLKD